MGRGGGRVRGLRGSEAGMFFDGGVAVGGKGKYGPIVVPRNALDGGMGIVR